MAAKKKRPAKRPAKKSSSKSKPKPKAPAPAKPQASVAERVAALARVFAALGAKHPEDWARRHVEQNSDELGRFVLLRALWLRLVEPGRALASAQNDAVAGASINRLMGQASLVDLDALVRHAQRTALNDVLRVLDDPSDNDEGIRWRLFRVDQKGVPLWPLSQLRKDLDDTAP